LEALTSDVLGSMLNW